MPGLTIYSYELDENSYRVRLALSMLGIEAKMVAVDMFPGREELKPAMLALDPRGTLPVLQEGDLVLSGAEAILAYLAKIDESASWLPQDPADFGRVQMWLHFSATTLESAKAARLQALFDTPGDEAALRRAARNAFRIMDDHMTMRHFDDAGWFAGHQPTLADLTLFPSFALSRDFGIDHDEFPALRLWIRRFRVLKGFITMPGIPDYH